MLRLPDVVARARPTGRQTGPSAPEPGLRPDPSAMVRARPDVNADADRTRPGPSGITVLLVDDDAAVRRVTGRYLALLGYTVVEAASGWDALALTRAELRIDLLLSDIALPGMRGPALLEALRQQQPALRAVLMTGYAAEALDPGQWPANTGLITKPFTLDELRACLARCLRRATCDRSTP